MTDSKPDVKDEPDFIDNNSLDGTKTTPVFEQGTVDPVYQAKAHVLNNATQQIGMGKYQWELVSLHLSRAATRNRNLAGHSIGWSNSWQPLLCTMGAMFNNYANECVKIVRPRRLRLGRR